MHTQLTIHGWTAGRSGPTMTVKGRDAEGREIKIPNVKVIMPDGGSIVAVDVGQQRFELAVAGSRQDLIDRINGILDVGTGDKAKDAALAPAKISDIRMLLDSLN